jgi:hypothetical protein
LGKLLEYKRNWIQHVNRMPRNRLPRVMKHCSPTGRRNHGRPLKRLLDTWERVNNWPNSTTDIWRWWWLWWWWCKTNSVFRTPVWYYEYLRFEYWHGGRLSWFLWQTIIFSAGNYDITLK